MRRRERIPIHDHSDFNSGGHVKASVIVGVASSSSTSSSSGIGINDVVGSGLFTRTSLGGQDVVSTVAAAGTATTLDLTDGNVFDVTLTAGTCAITFAGAVDGPEAGWVVDFRQDGTGNRTVTYTQTITWAAGTAPALGTAASSVTSAVFRSSNAFATIYGYPVGGSSSGVAGGTPALILGTANSAGTATTAVLTDATVAVFNDTAYPSSQTERTKSTGDDAYAARRDHAHGGGALLIADTHSTPIVFADVITNEATDDFLYSDA
jgi:hypothetical protein